MVTGGTVISFRKGLFMAVCDLSADPPSLDSLGGCVTGLIKLLVTLGGIAAVIVFLMGAFKYVTSGGDDKAVGEAKATLTWAVIGLVVIAVSYAVITLIGKLFLSGPDALLTFPNLMP